MLTTKLRILDAELSKCTAISPQMTLLQRFIASTTLSNVSWLDFVNFISSSSERTYEDLFCVANLLSLAPNKTTQELFREFYLSYPDMEWASTEHPEVDCFYPGNLESVAEQESLYASAVHFTPARASYATPYHMPALYSPELALIDNGPQAHSAQPVSAGSLSFFNPINKGISVFCAMRRAAKGVTVTPASGVESGARVDDAYHYVPQFWRMSLGQEADILSQQARVRRAMQEATADTLLLLYGVSRGAATTFTSLAHAYRQPGFSTSDFAKVAGVILEAPFNQVAGDLQSKTYFNSYVIPRIMDHNPDGISPANQVEHFPPNIPVLFITSKVDRKVPMSSTATLARNLAARGQNQVYLLTLDFSAHPNYPHEHPYDRHKYLTAVHAFRRYCGLAHSARLAVAGEEYLAASNLIRPEAVLPEESTMRRALG